MPLKVLAVALWALTSTALAREPDRWIDLWTGTAPGETTHDTGEVLPPREGENPPATRITGITRPRIGWFEAPEERLSGAAMLVFPGGGYNYVVSDKEGSEAAEWLNSLGISAGVVLYRTKLAEPGDEPEWSRSVQDGQRAVRCIRSQVASLHIDPDRIGVLGFSAGGRTAALVATRFETTEYEKVDGLDDLSCRPDLCLLMYPWQLANESGTGLVSEVTVTRDTPPTFLVHAHDDSVTPLSSVQLYATLLAHKVPAELHVYDNGGHGYGLRPVADSSVDTWPARAADWLSRQGWTAVPDSAP
jgi:acetyl esterase/lipase